MLAKYTTVLLLLLGAASSAAAEQPPAARRLVSGRNLGSPSDFFNDLLKSAAPALEKAVGHMKFKDYDHDGVKLTNLRTFDFDCSDGCLSGSIKGMRVSIDVHKFSLRLHSRYKAHKIITVQGECDFQIKDTDGSGSAAISSLSPFQLSGVQVDVNVGKLVPSCSGIAGAVVNVAVHLFQDKIVDAIKNAAESAIRSALEGHGVRSLGSPSSVGCLPNGEYCSGGDPCCGSCGWNGLCGDSKLRGQKQQEQAPTPNPFVVAADTQCIEDFQKCGHGHENCCNNGLCLYQSGCNGGFGGTCCDNKRRLENEILTELGFTGEE